MRSGKSEGIDIRDLPSWQYFSWGILNGLLLGISIKHGLDVSETGIMIQILNVLISLLESFQISSMLINTIIALTGIIGLLSFITEIVVIYKKGWPQRIIAGLGFVSLLLLMIGIEKLGITLIVMGAFLVVFFPNK